MFEETLHSEECAWFEDQDEHDEDYDLFDEEDEADDEDDDDVDDRAPPFIEYRCSPGCRFSPTIRGVVERYLEEARVLLNVRSGALVVPDLDDRLWRASYLSAAGQLATLLTAWTEHRGDVVGAMLAVTPKTPRSVFAHVEHDVRDLYILTATIGLNPRSIYRWGTDWSTQLALFERELVAAPDSLTGLRWETSQHRKHFYACRDGMRAADPEEREAYRARDAKRRRTRHRKEYLAEYEARPDVRAKRAAQKRAARAAARARRSQPEQKEMLPLSAAAPVDLSREATGDAPAELVPSEASAADVGDRPRVIIAQSTASTPSPAANRTRAA